MALSAISVNAKTYSEMFGDRFSLNEDQKYAHEQLDYKQGRIELGVAGAVLDVPEGYYFLSRQDAATVLFDGWGNPPDDDVVGMLFATDVLPLVSDKSKVWGIAVSYLDTGHVSEEDASSADFDEVLKLLRDGAEESNEWLAQNGYRRNWVVGWAAQPFYDSETKAAHWAKEVKFEGVEEPILNYDLRVLAREGVLSMEYIAGMDQLEIAKQSIPEVITMIEFEKGSRYADYNWLIDSSAGYGIAGLMLAGAAVNPNAAKKFVGGAGIAALFAKLAFMLKKFWYLAFAGLFGLAKLFRRR